MRQPLTPRTGRTPTPRIPSYLQGDFESISVKNKFLQAEGGISREKERVTSKFVGALLPINAEDLGYLPEGTVTTDSQKLYTNGETLKVGQLVRDKQTGYSYTVTSELTHGNIHPLKRYLVTRRGESANRGAADHR